LKTESNLFSLFQISLDNYFDIKFRLWKEHNLDPAWLESIPFYEYQLWVSKLNKYIDERNRKKSEGDGLKEAFNFSKMI
jgi:hypothetical protein